MSQISQPPRNSAFRPIQARKLLDYDMVSQY